MRRLAYAILLTLAGCAEEVQEVFYTCVLDIGFDADPGAVQPGDSVTMRTIPASAAWDTRIRVGGVDATITGVNREDESTCLDCDNCRAEQNCLTCGSCDPCNERCAGCTVQETTFIVPQVQGGVWPISVFNRHGSAIDLPMLEVSVATPDTSTDTDPDTQAVP